MLPPENPFDDLVAGDATPERWLKFISSFELQGWPVGVAIEAAVTAVTGWRSRRELTNLQRLLVAMQATHQRLVASGVISRDARYHEPPAHGEFPFTEVVHEVVQKTLVESYRQKIPFYGGFLYNLGMRRDLTSNAAADEVIELFATVGGLRPRQFSLLAYAARSAEFSILSTTTYNTSTVADVSLGSLIADLEGLQQAGLVAAPKGSGRGVIYTDTTLTYRGQRVAELCAVDQVEEKVITTIRSELLRIYGE